MSAEVEPKAQVCSCFFFEALPYAFLLVSRCSHGVCCDPPDAQEEEKTNANHRPGLEASLRSQ